VAELLLLKPGQVHCSGGLSGCDGWSLVFRAELLRSAPSSTRRRSEVGADQLLAELEPLTLAEVQRTHRQLSAATRHSVTEVFERMADRARRPACGALTMMMRSRVRSPLLCLQLDGAVSAADDHIGPVALQRHRRYRTATAATSRAASDQERKGVRCLGA